MTTSLDTYDPAWAARWDEANQALQALPAQSEDWRAFDPSIKARHEELLNILYLAYAAQFQTVEDVIEHDLQFVKVPQGLDVALPHFPAGISVAEARAIIHRFEDDIAIARAASLQPSPADPSGMVAFTTPPRAGCQRVIEDFFLPRSIEGPPVSCTLVMEATKEDVHVCFVSRRNAGSVTNNIERLATEVYRERYAAPRHWAGSLVRLLGGAVRPSYSPHQMVFYDYFPISASTYCRLDELSIVKLEWDRRAGFLDPDWTHFGTIPPYLVRASQQPSQVIAAKTHLALPAPSSRRGATNTGSPA